MKRRSYPQLDPGSGDLDDFDLHLATDQNRLADAASQY